MKVIANRGVCIAPFKHLAPDEEGEVDEGTATFLIGIGAVRPKPEPEPEPEAAVSTASALAEPEPKGAKVAPKKGT